MTNKEIVKEMFKMVSICGGVKMKKDGKWVTIAQLKKEDVEQIEKDIDEYEQLKKGLKMTQEEMKEEILKEIELSPAEKMYPKIMWKVTLNQTGAEDIRSDLRFTYDEEDLIRDALIEYINNHKQESKEEPANKKECKYLKTKSGIYERDKCCVVLDYEDSITECVEIRKGGLTSSSSTLENIIKQSDDLIDLCDEFVIVSEGNEPNEIMDDIQIEHYVKDGYVIDESKMYGAIWTDTGLKYVCKLNDKGELELL